MTKKIINFQQHILFWLGALPLVVLSGALAIRPAATLHSQSSAISGSHAAPAAPMHHPGTHRTTAPKPPAEIRVDFSDPQYVLQTLLGHLGLKIGYFLL